MSRLLKLTIILSSIITCLSETYAQQTIVAFERNDAISFRDDADLPFSMPLTGGFNYVTAGEIDLNLDGTKDLVLFDRSGDRATPLIWNNGEFVFAAEFISQLPIGKHFMQFRDFNCDGKSDIFTYSDGGFKVFKNISSAGTGLQFEVYSESLMSFYNPGTLPIYSIPIDVPALEDMDGDGDLDLLVFGILGTCVEFHRNMAVEQLSRCDTLVLRLETNNWGNFTEALSTNEVILNDSCDAFGGRYNQSNRHAGSSLLAIDMNGDGDKDLLLGDIAYRTMIFLSNGGTATNANVVAQESPWPSNTLFVNLSVFPAASYVDIDHDGDRDLFVSPNGEGGSENLRCIWYYTNVGTDASPIFEHVQKDLFVKNSLDFGEGSMPTFCDYNQDGLKDIVIGNYGYFENNGTYRPQLALYENVGTSAAAQYKLVTSDLANLSTLSGNALNFFPTFGDVDGDGDDDMLIGASDGRIFYYVNTALAGDVANFVFVTPIFQNIDIGTFATPQLVDVDGDGLLDLIIGSREGRIHYYHNSGTPQTMILDFVTNSFGSVLTALPGNPSGFSTPCFFKKSGISYLMCGSQNGRISLYSGIDGNLEGNFVLEDSLVLGDRIGERTTITVADLNSDGFLDAVVGNYAGGINFFEGIFASSFSNSASLDLGIRIFPNPSRTINISSRDAFIESMQIIDIQGRIIDIRSFSNATTLIQVDGANFPEGMYLIQIQSSKGASTHKWINN
jgi:hypothetical protein